MKKTITYTCTGTCARQIDIQIEEGVLQSVAFTGGCPGNHEGINALVKGMTPEQVITRLEGIDCRGRGTSCPDQLAKALKGAL